MRFQRIHHGATDSTSERAFAAIESGSARHGDLHVATGQSAGRGRFGRRWFSPPDEGLYLSLVLLPPPPPWSPAALTMATGLAVFDAAQALGCKDAWLKWPNDLMVGRAKLAGILVETRGFHPERPHYVVGIGMNVRQRTFPEELRAEREVTSLALLGIDVSLERAEECVTAALGRRVDDLGDIANRETELCVDFISATRLLHQPVRALIGEEETRGTLAGLSIAHGLLLHLIGGREARLPLEFVRELERV